MKWAAIGFALFVTLSCTPNVDGISVDSGPCQGNAVIGSWMSSSFELIIFYGNCSMIISTCNTSLRYPSGMSATTSTPVDFTVDSSDGSSGCPSAGSVLSCYYSLDYTSVSSTKLSLNCGYGTVIYTKMQ